MAISDINTTKQAYLDQFYQTLLGLLNSSGTGLGDISTPRLSLIAMTKVKIDELMAQAEGVEFNLNASDNSNIIDLYLNALLDESGTHILQTAPLHAIIPTDGSTLTPQFSAGSENGYLWLPDDYLRFVSLRISGWLRDATTLRKITDPEYKLQSTVLKGGKAKPEVFINSKVRTNTPKAQIESATLTGTDGTLRITGPGGLDKTVEFNASLTQTAADFVALYSANYTARGITLTSSGETLTWTANVEGTAFDHVTLITLDGDISGFVTIEQPNVPLKEGRKIIEYYSDPSKLHVLDKFMYIANVGAEYIQTDLHAALTWLCAAKLLQIWGQTSGNTSPVEMAMKQVELCYENLNV